MPTYEKQLRGQDTISGQEGKAYITDPDTGEVILLFELKNLEAKLEKQKEDIKTVGRAVNQKKTTGWSGTGSMTLYYVTSYFRDKVMDYINGGRDLYFTMQVINSDPTSETYDESTGIGQKVTLTGCNLDGQVLAKIDTQSAVLEEEANFTFTGATLDQSFQKITSGL